MLSKREYFAINKMAFEKLTNNQREEKYKSYRDRYIIKNANTNADKRIITTVRKVNNNNNNNTNRNRIATENVRFSKCLINFAKASIDPFGNIQELPCIPDMISVPSHKFKTWVETTLVVGLNGYGWAVMNPWSMAVNNATAVDPPGYIDLPVITTTATYTHGNTYTNTYAELVAGETQYAEASSPFDYNTIQNAGIRLVAAGMMAEYTGTLMNQSGVVTVLQNDDLRSFTTPTSLTTIRTHSRAQNCPTTRESQCYVRYEQTGSLYTDYRQISSFMPSKVANAAQLINYPLIIAVSGAEPGTTFRVRAVAYFELQQRGVQSTPSESDVIGYSAFQSARTFTLPTQDPKRDLLTIMKQTAYNIGNSISGFAPVVGRILGSTVGSPELGEALGGISKNIIDALMN